MPIMILAESASLVYTLIYIWLFRRFIDRRSLVSLGMSFGKQYRKDFVMGLVWGGAMAAAVFGLLWMFGLAQIQRIQFPIMSVLVMAATLFLAAAQEELLMRGYLLNNLIQSANKYLSLLIVSILFSIGHVLNPNFTLIGLLNIILAGLYLGIYYIYRQNLWFPIGIHFAWNWFQGGVFGSPVSGFQMQSVLVVQFNGSDSLSGGGFGFEGSLFMTVVATLTVILLHLIYRKPRNGRQSTFAESPQPEQK
jgi:membrane protease YdiL (CAAX protease family)